MGALDWIHRVRPSDGLLAASDHAADGSPDPIDPDNMESLAEIGERVIRGIAWRAMGWHCQRSLDVSLTPAEREEAVRQVRAIAHSSGVGPVA